MPTILEVIRKKAVAVAAELVLALGGSFLQREPVRDPRQH
jgi:hypothetical protein